LSDNFKSQRSKENTLITRQKSRGNFSPIKRIVIIAIIFVTIAVVMVAFSNMLPRLDNNRNNFGNSEDKPNNTTEGSSLGIATVSAVTPYVTEYLLPNGTAPNAILVDRNGIVWTVGSTGILIELDPKSGHLTSYQIPEESGKGDRMSWSIVEGNDNLIWFAQFGSVPLWRFDPVTDKFESFHTSGTPFQMKVDGKTDDIWFTTLTGDTLGVIQKVNNTEPHYQIKEFPTGNDTYPSGLTLRGDSVWVTELERGKVAKFDVIRDDSGVVTDVKKILEVPTKTQLSEPTDLLFSSNGTLWITEHGPSTITKFGLDSQEFTRFATSQNRYGVASLPFWLRESLDGQGFWFNEHEGERVGFFDVPNMTLTEFEVPSSSPDVFFMLNFATDPHDASKAWFSEWNADKIGVVDRSISVPFDIRTDLDKVVLGSSNLRQEIGVEISGNGIPASTNYTTVYLNASSSMEPAAGFVNMSATFPEGDAINLSDTSKQNFKLLLEDHFAPPGNYTLGISATNGIVAKTIFLDLVVKS
jgi:streptogramin lyase